MAKHRHPQVPRQEAPREPGERGQLPFALGLQREGLGVGCRAGGGRGLLEVVEAVADFLSKGGPLGLGLLVELLGDQRLEDDHVGVLRDEAVVDLRSH